MKFCKFKEYTKGIANSISYLSDAPFTTLKFPNESWFSDTKTEFEEELFGNINNTKDIDTLYCFYEKIIEKAGIRNWTLHYHTNLFEKCVENELFEEYELTKTAYDYILSVFECDNFGHWEINGFMEKHKTELGKKNIKVIAENNDLSSKIFTLEVEFDRISDEKRKLELEVEKLRNEISTLNSKESILMLENEELKKENTKLSVTKITTTQISQEENHLKIKWNSTKPKKILACLFRELRNRGYLDNSNEELAKFLISYTDIFANGKESSIISNYLRVNSNDSNRNIDDIESIISSALADV